MEKFKEKAFYEDNFFIVSSENYRGGVKSRIYGFVFLNDKILINYDSFNDIIPNDSYGVYVNIINYEKQIIIQQDYFGSFGLYVYNIDGFFAVSNSFLYLVNYLKTRKELSFDWEYSKAFLAAPQASLSFTETMIKEIKMLPRNSYIDINKESGQFKVKYFEQKEHYIPVNSKQAIELIDTWHTKWNIIFNTLIERGEALTFFLSGGKDSRVSLACLMKPKLDFNRVIVYSTNDKLHTHSDDYRIASNIAKKYGFELKPEQYDSRYKMNPETNLNLSMLIKCGFHRELMLSHFWWKKPCFRVTGSGGDLRDLWNEGAQDFIERNCNDTVYNTIDCRGALKKQMKRTKDEIDNFFDNTKCYTANDYFYKYGRQRNHNGKANAELFLANVFILSPLMDPILYRLSQNIGKDNDNDLLYAIIYNRYLPEIDELGFDSNRIVLEKTKCIAAEINKKYPIKTTYVESKALPILYRRECPGKSNNGHNSLDYLKDAFYSGEVKEFCKKFYGEEIYVKADEYYKKREYHPYIAGAGLVESYVIWKASQISNEVNYWAENQTPNRLDSYEEPLNYYNNGIMNEILDYLKSGRIDIQKKGTEKSDIIILESSDPNLYIEKVKDGESGNGYILQSCKCQLTLKIAVKESGTLSVFLKGPWMRDSSNCPLPIKIDFLKLLIRDDKGVELIAIKDITTVDSSKTQMVECKVANNKKYYIYAEWTAHAYSNAEISKLITEMSKIRIDRYLFWKH